MNKNFFHNLCTILKILNYVTFRTQNYPNLTSPPVETGSFSGKILLSNIVGSAANVIGYLDMPSVDEITIDM